MTTVRAKITYLAASLLTIGVVSFTALSADAGAQNTDIGAPASGSSCTQSFLTFPAWYKGILTSDCEIMSPTEHPNEFPGFVWTIGLNLVEIILNLVGYAAVAFIIYGGYKYMTSAGSPDGMVSARKTIMNAVIGLIISIAAVGIVRTISSGLGVG